MSQVDVRGKAVPERNQEIPRSAGWSFPQGASMATLVGRAVESAQEGRPRRKLSTSF